MLHRFTGHAPEHGQMPAISVAGITAISAVVCSSSMSNNECRRNHCSRQPRNPVHDEVQRRLFPRVRRSREDGMQRLKGEV